MPCSTHIVSSTSSRRTSSVSEVDPEPEVRTKLLVWLKIWAVGRREGTEVPTMRMSKVMDRILNRSNIIGLRPKSCECVRACVFGKGTLKMSAEYCGGGGNPHHFTYTTHTKRLLYPGTVRQQDKNKKTFPAHLSFASSSCSPQISNTRGVSSRVAGT